ncbi:MAG: transposase [Verrucomicrobiota bacterium]
MARPVRIEYPGAFYHVSAQGFGAQKAFLNDADYGSFLNLLGETCDKTGWRVHAYCLTPVKYHIFVETPDPNLVSGMTWLQNSYTMDHNNRRGHRDGAVFGDRYRSVPVEVDPENDGGEFYRAMLDYIHLKPIRRELIQPTDDLRVYRFSSVSFYDVAIGMRGAWQKAALGLKAFGFTDTAVGRNQFIDRLNERKRLEPADSVGLTQIKDQSPHSTLRRGWYFGSLDFRHRLNHLKREAAPAPAAACEDDELAQQILHFGLPKLQLKTDSLGELPKGDWRKALLAHLLTRHTTVTLSWVADRLQMGSRSGVCRWAQRFERDLATHPERQRDAERILAWARAELNA